MILEYLCVQCRSGGLIRDKAQRQTDRQTLGFMNIDYGIKKNPNLDNQEQALVFSRGFTICNQCIFVFNIPRLFYYIPNIVIFFFSREFFFNAPQLKIFLERTKSIH